MREVFDLPFGLYVHIPFCARKCPYCDFNTFSVDRGAMDRFMDALFREVDLYAGSLPTVDTVFVGGGTPTVYNGDRLAALMHHIGERVHVRPDAEVSIEANPGSLTPKKADRLLASGVNRLSLGAQSLQPWLLGAIGRNHTVEDILEAFDIARRAGFANINLDLMFALPNQTMGHWQETVEGCLALEPEHFSCYSLIIEEDTPFADLHREGRLPRPTEDLEVEMYRWMLKRMGAAGYRHYEISNLARPGYECLHNLIYWRNQPFLGIGPGAHSYWQGQRFANVRPLGDYVEQVTAGQRPVQWRESIDADDEMDETMMMGLRLIEGVSDKRFAQRFHCSLRDVYGPQLDRLQRMGAVEYSDGRLRLSDRGLPVANQVFAAFLRRSRQD